MPVECACGCGMLIPRIPDVKYVLGHEPLRSIIITRDDKPNEFCVVEEYTFPKKKDRRKPTKMKRFMIIVCIAVFLLILANECRTMRTVVAAEEVGA